MTVAADHQLRGERPGLARDVGHVAHPNAAFLEHLALDRFLDRLPRFDEACQGGKAPFGPAETAPQHQPAVMLYQHDRHRVGAREMAGTAGLAIALPAAFRNPGVATALRTEAVARMPVDNAACTAVKRQVAGIERGHE